MKFSRISWSRSFANLRRGAATIALSLGAAVAAAAPLSPTVSSNLDLLGGSAAATVVVDWTTTLTVTPLQNGDADRPALPSLDADEFKQPTENAASDKTSSNDDASSEDRAAGETAQTETQPNADAQSSENASEEAAGEGYSEYYKYKFGYVERHYGDNDDAAAPVEENLDNDRSTTDYDFADKSDETASTESADSTRPSDAPKADATAESETEQAADGQVAKDLDAASENATGENATDDVKSDSTDTAEYDRYRYESIDRQFGSDASANDGREDGKSDAADAKSDDESESGVNVEDGDESSETASDAENEGSPMADAIVSVFARWAEISAANYGLNLAQLNGVMGR